MLDFAHITKATSSPPAARLQLIHIVLFARQFLKSHALRLRHKEARQHAQEHEERKHAHHVMDPRIGVIMRSAIRDHGREEDLRKDGAQLAHACAETIARAADPRWEDLSRGKKRRGVGAEVEEELREDVEREQMDSRHTSPRESEDAKDDGEDAEAGDLEPLSANAVDGEDGEAVAWEGAGTNQDNLARGGVAQGEVEVFAWAEAHAGHERSRGEAKAVEAEIEEA